MTDQTVTLRLVANANGLTAGVGQANRELARIGVTSEQSGRRATVALAETERGTRSLTTVVADAKRQVAGFFGAFVSIQGARTLARLADEYSNIRGQLQLVSRDQAALATAEAQTFAISQRTSAALSSTVELYTRLTRSTAEYGISQARNLRLTEVINQTFTVSSTAATAQANAITQLTQAFGGGVLRAEEFNSILENSPRLAQVFADGIEAAGGSVGKLRTLVNDGKVDVESMVLALENQAARVAEEFATMPLTIERAWTRIGNAVLQYVGQADQASGTSREVAEAMAWVAENMESVAHAAITLAKIVATIYGAKLLIAAAAYTLELVAQTTATRGLIVAQSQWAASTAGSFAEARKNIGLLGTALNLVGVAVVGWQIGTYLREEFLEARLAGIVLVEAVLVLWERLKQGALVAWEVIKTGGQYAWDSIKFGVNLFVADALDGMGKVASVMSLVARGQGNFALADMMAQAGAQIRGYAAGIDATAPSMDGVKDRIGAINAAANDQVAKIREVTSEMVDFEITNTLAAKAAENAGDSAAAATDKTKSLGGGMAESNKAGAAYVKNLQDLVTSYGLTGAALERYRALQQGLTPGQLVDANEAIAEKEALDAKAAAANEAADALESLRGITAGQASAVNDMRAKLLGTSAAQLAFNKTVHASELALEAAGGALNPKALEAYEDAVKSAQENLDLTNAVELIDSAATIEGTDAITAAIGEIEEALKAAMDPDIVAALNEALGKLNLNLDNSKDSARETFEQYLAGSKVALQGLQTLTKEGSRDFEALGIAIEALTIAEGIMAIVHQASQGDVYTAIPRMVAVAAAIAALGVRVKAFSGGGFSDTAAQRQETQGTGSVLGDATADSESIANGVEITAEATSALVAINRGMLRALQAMQAGIGAATTMLARGAGDADFSGMNLAVGQNSLNSFLDGAGILGGSSKITDQGIIIFGGALNELLENIAVGAYQEVQSRSWAFGSTHTREGITDVSDEFGAQFQLIMQSIADTVREGALALGLLPADIDAAMAAYKVEEIRISLKGLSAEEQQAELAAVFGKIFDGLAGDVVPFLGQFQRVGEGLGETLVRVATGVQVTQEGVRQLGFALDETDPERFAQISESLLEMTGGIEEFISGMTSFVSAFAPEAHKFEVASTALTAAFEQAGLTVPATAEGMWDLMQSLDATTEEGREQIATLLRLSGVAKQYYDMQEKQLTQATDLLEELGLAEIGMSDFGRELVSISAQGKKAEEAANLIARAQGREGASAIQLARIHQWTADQMVAAYRRLEQQTQDLIAKLFGGIPGSLDAINDRIGELEGSAVGAADAIGDVENASAQLFESWAQGIKGIQEYLDSMLLGDLSALAPEEQLAEAQRQLMETQARAVGGDADALNQLPQMADAYLRLLRGSAASGEDYNTGFQWVRDLLTSVVDMQNPGTPGGAGNPGPVELVPSAELRELYAARDAAQAEQDKAQRAEWARQLTQNLADLATILQVPVLSLLEARDVNLRDLAADVGVDFDNIGASSVAALGFLASTLGVSMTELTSNLGISLVDLRAGLTEMATSVGVDLSAMTVETTQTLAALAGTLGMDLSELETSLGISLGSLRDADSLVNRALGAEIGTLPKEQRDALEPLLTAITTATNAADANVAIKALETAVNGIGGATANQLAPYLAGVMPVKALTQLDFLEDIKRLAGEQLDVMKFMRENLKAANSAAGVPSYAVGTGYVPHDGLAMIHEGEAIIPAPFAAWMRSNGLPVSRGGGGNDERVVVELRSIRERLESLERSNSAGHNKIAQTVGEEGGKARTQRDDIARRNQDTQRSRSA